MRPSLGFVVFALLLAVASATGMLAHLGDEPYSIHEWRQRDALSQTLRYLEPGRGFFEPAIHFQHADGGRGAGEFTGLYYMNALLWKGWGSPLPWTLRWTQLAFLIVGLTALYRVVWHWTASTWAAAIAAIAVFLSPLIQFYGSNYLVNSSALMVTFVAWWMGGKSESGARSAVWMFGAGLMMALAGLLRPTMLLGGIPLAIRWWTRRPTSWSVAVGTAAIPIGLVVAWVIWAKSYNAANHSTYFLTTIRPLWETPDASRVWDSLVRIRLQEIYHVHVRFALAALLAFTALRGIRTRSFEGTEFVLTAVGLLGYGLLWFKNLDVHDYYLLEFLLLVPLAVAWVAGTWRGSVHAKRIFWMLLLLGAYQTAHTTARNRLKWGVTEGWLVERFVPAWERSEWAWFHQDQRARWLPLNGLPERFEEWGIRDSDWVLSLPDPSPNTSLTRMNRFGFTGLFENDLHAGARVAWAVDRGARVLVINKPALLEEGDWGDWLDHPLGVHEGIQVFLLERSQE